MVKYSYLYFVFNWKSVVMQMPCDVYLTNCMGKLVLACAFFVFAKGLSAILENIRFGRFYERNTAKNEKASPINE